MNENEKILDFQWENKYLEKLYSSYWMEYINHSLHDIFEFRLQKDTTYLYWKSERFKFQKIKTSRDSINLLLKQDNDHLSLLKGALDRINYGVQIYDKNACSVYFNIESRKISEIPEDLQTEGLHLLDLYDYSPELSTVMTCLKNAAPVINRFYNFKTKSGINITTINTAYPVFHQNELIGSVTIEYDYQHIIASIKKLEEALTLMRSAPRNTIENSSQTKKNTQSFMSIIGKGKKITDAVELAKKVAQQDCNIMLVGETGTGKEIFAQSIHNASNRNHNKLLAINCAAIPETLIESLLFGAKKGAYTDGTEQIGYFEQANGGTLFLDELNSMSIGMQSKILRVIQEGTFRKLGSNTDQSTNVRIISSCNQDPFRLLNTSTLRKDLFYRLSTVVINLPPLREHSEDVEELVRYYINQQSTHYAKPIKEISPDVLNMFKHYKWPGNIRELFHILDYVLNVVDEKTIEINHLPQNFREAFNNFPVYTNEESDHVTFTLSDSVLLHTPLQVLLDEYESYITRKALELHGFNITKTSCSLGIKRQSLQYRIKKYGIVY